MQLFENSTPKLTRWYVGSRYMKEDSAGTVKEYTWIGGDAYSAPVLGITSSGNTSYYYLLRDYLGSITHVIDATDIGNFQEYSYDAWGRRRVADDWTSYDLTNEPYLMADRGFTGHEHLSWFNLVNMNGRLYDPLLGRFLSPDEYVQMPDFSQNFNRYSYAFNNPLTYTDPNGEFIPLIAFAIWGGYANTISHMHDMDNLGEGLGYFFTGAAVSAAGAWVGGAVANAINIGGFAGGFLSGASGGFAGGFVGGTGNAWLNGSDFGSGLITGLNTGLKSGLVSGGAGGLLGGFDALSSDGTFWNGRYKGEIGGLGKSDWEGKFLDEKIPSGVKPTKTGEIAFTDENPNYGKYGWTRSEGAQAHFGVDYAGDIGDDVYSMYGGKVTRLWNSSAYGPNATRISSTINGKYYNVDYGHLSKSVLSINQSVNAGDLVGYMGRLGNIAGTSFPTHVHIAVWRPLPGQVMGFVMPWWK